MIILLTLPLITREGIVTTMNSSDNAYDGFIEFKSIMAYKESRFKPKAVSPNGYYRGLYQFGESAAKDVKVNYDSLFVPKWSDTALVRYMRLNWIYLNRYHSTVGHTIDGIVITKAKLLCAAHKIGHAWVAEWIKTEGKTNATDGNGVSVRDCFRMMENVELKKY